MATTNDLLQDVYANFLSAYKQGSGSASANVIAFEAVGLSPGLSIEAPNGNSLAVESVSREADKLPDISTGIYSPTLRTVSVTYEDMLDAATPVSETGAETFNALKANAKETFQNSALGSQSGPVSFQPAFATPASWYDDTKQANWTSYSYKPAGVPHTQGSPAADHPPGNFQRLPAWQLRRNIPAAALPGAQAHVPTTVAAAGQFHPEFAPDASAAPPAVARQFQPIWAGPGRTFGPRGDVPAGPAAAPSAQAPAAPAPSSATQPALQADFSMSFDYCIVQLYRPWLSGDFLATTNWYVPGTEKGDASSGPVTPAAPAAGAAGPSPTASTDPSASANAGYAAGFFAYIPVAFIAIKSLVLNTTAIDGEDSSHPAIAFGPFSLAHASGSSNALFAPGIQIIGWICSVQPVLPPYTDPALLPPSNADQTQAVVNDVIDILGGLFGEKSK